MKKIIFSLAVLALVPGIGFAALYETEKITTADDAKTKILDLARKDNYLSPGEICRDSNLFKFKSRNYSHDSLAKCLENESCLNTQYEINNIVPRYAITECLRDAESALIQAQKEAAEEEQRNTKAREEEKQKEADKLAAKKAEDQALEAELKAGKKKPSTFKQALIFYGATDGTGLASAPKIKPDMAYYAMSGIINSANNEDDSIIAKLYTGVYLIDASPRYYKVIIPDELKQYYYDTAKIGSIFGVIGRYTENVSYNTVSGEEKSMPVFQADYLKILK
jgi:hypothetical protein